MANNGGDYATRARVPVAGIGASAGGIQALRSFFELLPEKVGAAFVIIVHLDPNHPSELASVLAKSTPMRVIQVDHRQQRPTPST